MSRDSGALAYVQAAGTSTSRCGLSSSATPGPDAFGADGGGAQRGRTPDPPPTLTGGYNVLVEYRHEVDLATHVGLASVPRGHAGRERDAAEQTPEGGAHRGYRLFVVALAGRNMERRGQPHQKLRLHGRVVHFGGH